MPMKNDEGKTFSNVIYWMQSHVNQLYFIFGVIILHSYEAVLIFLLKLNKCLIKRIFCRR